MAKTTTITVPTQRPKALGAKLQLKTIDQVDAALAELQWLRQRSAAISSEIKEEQAAIVKSHEKQLRITVDGQAVTLNERATALEACVVEWANKNLKAHLEGDSKTLRLDHGAISAKTQQMAIEVSEDTDEAAVLQELDGATGYCTWLTAFLCRAMAGMTSLLKGDSNKITHGDFLTVKVELSRAKILQAVKDGRVGDDHLQALGLRIRKPFDKIEIKV